MTKGRKIRILLLTQWCEPEPVLKGVGFAKELMLRGYDVEVLTGFPNYPTGIIYSGYRLKVLQREDIDGVHLTRVFLYPSHDSSVFRRALNYVSFFLSSVIYGSFFSKKFDVIYAYHPPLTTALSACVIGLFRRRPVVLDIQDLWPDSLFATGFVGDGRVARLAGKLCDFVYRRVDRIVVLSPGFLKVLVDRGVSEKKVDVIYNWADEAQALTPKECTLPSTFPGRDKFKILYAGNLGKAQSLGAVLATAKILQEKGSNIVFVFVGGGVEADLLRKQAFDSGIRNVSFYPQVSMESVASYLDAADVLLVHLKKNPLFEITIPSKTQAYMRAGKPLLMAVGGDAENLVLDAKCGLAALPEDPEDIARVAEIFSRKSAAELSDYGKSGKYYYEKNLAFRVGVSRFSKIFEDITRVDVN